MKRWLWLMVLLGFCCGVYHSRAAGLIIVEDPSWHPGPIPPPRPIPPPWPPPRPHPLPRPYVFAPMEVSFVKVHTRITDQIATTAIDQEFYNPNSARLEGTFVFPVPKGAHLDKFSMEIDGQKVQAELLSADKARRIYEDIVRNLKDPALLEYAGRDMFKVRIFPIEPHSKKRVSLSYTQLLKADAGLIAFVKACFLYKRKFLRHSLEVRYSPGEVDDLYRHMAFSRSVRAEEIEPEVFVSMYRFLNEGRGHG